MIFFVTKGLQGKQSHETIWHSNNTGGRKVGTAGESKVTQAYHVSTFTQSRHMGVLILSC